MLNILFQFLLVLFSQMPLDSFFENRMLIDKREIERVKRANELVGFIRSRGVALTQRGKQLVGLCPFRDDHEPSLVVDAKKRLWNCLDACHEGGDVYRFVMKADDVDFREAQRRLGGQEAESKCVMVEDQQWLERAVDHYHHDCWKRRQRKTTCARGASRWRSL